MNRKPNARHRSTPGTKTLSEKNVSANPFDQFRKWFQAAVDENIPQPNAMTLATASADGEPSSRIVLLKDADDRGFTFYTNYESRKGGQLALNPRAALLFYWPTLDRQVRIEGQVERLTREESMRYFDSRPRLSRIGAWASRQSEIIENRSILVAEFKKFERQFSKGKVPLPDYWGGFRLIPGRMEFWQNRPNRLHDRICYVREHDAWKIVRLSP
ncbi:MAG TPA: pyridoxamine 5'-phosphate oxidase [Bacteroidota bacterium]